MATKTEHKGVSFTLAHPDGARYKWSMRREDKAWHCGGNLPRPYVGPEWFLTRHDGSQQGVGATWFEAVRNVQLMVENMGCTSALC